MNARILLLSAVVLALAACGPNTPAGPPCDHSTDCGATEVCAGGGCVDALSVPYDVTLSMDIAPKEPDGSDWDTGGNPPDVHVTLEPVASGGIAGAPVLEWDNDESFHPSWTPQQATFTSKSLDIHAIDDDSTFGFESHDEICTVALPTDTAAFLHSGGGEIDGTSCNVNLEIVPHT